MSGWKYEYADSLQKVTVNTIDGYVECIAASYDGVPFFIEETETSGGRDVVTSPLPFSESHVNEDVGKKVRAFSCTIYLVGRTCELDRERLEDAFNREGAFELSHPYYGKFNARCTEYRFKYSTSVHEYVEGEVTFVPEQDPKKSARNVEDLRGTVIAKSESVLDAAKSDFVEKFSVVGKAKSIVDTVSGYTEKALDTIESARSSIRSVSQFVNTISKIRENMSLVLNAPSDFANRIQNLLTMTKETFSFDDGAKDYVNESLAVMDSAVAKKQDSAYLVADEMNSSIDRLMLMSAAAMATRSVVDSFFKSAEEAREMQDKVSSSFDAAAALAESFDDYMCLMDLQAAALKYLRDEMSKLAVVVELPMSASRDILSVCFDCYGDLDRVEEILERNEIGDPLVITRRELKVLSK